MIKKLYPNFKEKAFTLSYDDGVIQDRELTAIFNRFKVKATFNLNSGQSGVPKFRGDVDCSHLDIKESYHIYDGFEIATHTKTHPHLEDIYDLDVQIDEFKDDIKILSSWTKREIKGAAYPFGTYNHLTLEAIDKVGIEYARTVRPTYKFSCPVDFRLWHPTIHHRDARLFPLLDEFIRVDEELALFYLWGHAYEFGVDHNFELMEEVLHKVTALDNIYFGTNLEICRYLKAMNKLLIKNKMVINNSDLELYLLIDGKRVVLKPYERLETEND